MTRHESDKGRRSWHRYAVQIPVRVAIAQNFFPLATLTNFSASGMRIALPADTRINAKRGEIIQAGFALSQGRVRAQAALVRAERIDARVELGVSFESLNPAVHRGLLLASDAIRLRKFDATQYQELIELCLLRLRERLRLQIDWCAKNHLEGPEFFHALTRLQASWHDLAHTTLRVSMHDDLSGLAHRIENRFLQIGFDEVTSHMVREVVREVCELVVMAEVHPLAS